MTEIEKLQHELRAICQREAFFAAQGKLGDLTPWGDLSDEDREKAIEFYGWKPEDTVRVTHRDCPDCVSKGFRPKDVVEGKVLSWCGRCGGTGGVRVEVSL